MHLRSFIKVKSVGTGPEIPYKTIIKHKLTKIKLYLELDHELNKHKNEWIK